MNKEPEMSSEVLEWVAGKVIADVRDGQQVPSGMCRPFFTQRTVELVRSQIKSADWPAVRQFVEGAGTAEAFRLGIHLIQGILKDTRDATLRSQVYNFLMTLWRQEHRQGRERLSVIYSLLDMDDLPKETHEQLFQFIAQHQDLFVESNRIYAGGAGSVIEAARSRIEDPRFPRSKRWVYVLMGGIADSGCEEFVRPFLKDDDPLVQRAANKALEWQRDRLQAQGGMRS